MNNSNNNSTMCLQRPQPSHAHSARCNDDQVTRQEHLVLVGNPGAGKSAILNQLLGRNAFKSGVSVETGVTSLLQWCTTSSGLKLGDTPGLSDIETRSAAAVEISEALRQDGKYRLVFVLLLDNGRVRADDLATMKLVLTAIKDPTLKYAVLINQVNSSLMGKFD